VRNHTARIVWTLIFVLAGPVVWACSACVKDILSAEEFDRSSWDHFENVYVGLVTRAELSFPDHTMPRITYSVVTEEIFKGDPDTTGDIRSQRIVNRWNSRIEVIACGDVEVFVGDRLLIFSNPGESVYIGRCSASRIVDRMNSTVRRESADTLQRLRTWRDTP
jgi:hypothetical protein